MALTNTTPNPTIAARATVSLGNTVLQCVSMPGGRSETCEPIKVVTTAGAYEVSVPGAVTKSDTMDVKVLKDTATLPAAGDVVTLNITVTERVADSAETTDETLAIECVVTAVKPDTIEADGNRLEAVTVTLQPTNLDK